MSNLAVNNPEVVTEITALFEAYEQALIDKDIDTPVSYTHLTLPTILLV